jgi:hypothetical protein
LYFHTYIIYVSKKESASASALDRRREVGREGGWVESVREDRDRASEEREDETNREMREI